MVFKRDLIARACLISLCGASLDFQHPMRPEHRSGQPPGFDARHDADDLVAAVQENQVYREMHEEGMNPHDRKQWSAANQHPGARPELGPAHQATPPRNRAHGFFHLGTKDRTAGLINRP